MTSILPPSDDEPIISLEVDDLGRFVVTVQDHFGDHRRAILSAEAQEALVTQAAAIAAEKADRQTAMDVQVSALRYANYGDHAQMDHHALRYDPTETVEALILRGLELTSAYGRTNLESDHITLRVIKGTEPERVGSDVPPF